MSPTPRATTTAAALLSMVALLAAAPGCDGDDRSCVSRFDCFRGEICDPQQGRCVEANTEHPPDAGASSGEDAATSQGGDDAGRGPGLDLGDVVDPPTEDAGGGGAAGEDMGDPVGDTGSAAPTCKSEAATMMCAEDADAEPNSEFSTAAQLGSSGGCISPHEGLKESTGSYRGQLCPGDAADFFAITVVECETQAVYVTVEVEPLLRCDEGLYEVTVYRSGSKFDCVEDRDEVQCVTEADGTRRMTVLVPERRAGSGSFDFYVSVEPTSGAAFDFIQLPYEVRYRVGSRPGLGM